MCVGLGWVSEDIFVAIMRLRPEDLRKCPMTNFEGEDALAYGDHLARVVLPPVAQDFNLGHGLFEVFFFSFSFSFFSRDMYPK